MYYFSFYSFIFKRSQLNVIQWSVFQLDLKQLSNGLLRIIFHFHDFTEFLKMMLNIDQIICNLLLNCSCAERGKGSHDLNCVTSNSIMWIKAIPQFIFSKFIYKLMIWNINVQGKQYSSYYRCINDARRRYLSWYCFSCYSHNSLGFSFSFLLLPIQSWLGPLLVSG